MGTLKATLQRQNSTDVTKNICQPHWYRLNVSFGSLWSISALSFKIYFTFRTLFPNLIEISCTVINSYVRCTWITCVKRDFISRQKEIYFPPADKRLHVSKHNHTNATMNLYLCHWYACIWLFHLQDLFSVFCDWLWAHCCHFYYTQNRGSSKVYMYVNNTIVHVLELHIKVLNHWPGNVKTTV